MASLEYLLHALHHLLLFRHWRRRFIITKFNFGTRFRSQTSHIQPADESNSSILLSLSSMFSEARCTTRLFGLFAIWDQSIHAFQKNRGKSSPKAIRIAQILTITSYQLLENYAFLASKRVLPKTLTPSTQRIENCFAWGARALFLHLSMELASIGQEAFTSANPLTAETLINGKRAQEKSTKKSRVWRNKLFSTSIWAILCFHWSCPPGAWPLNVSSGALSFLADFSSSKSLWEATMQK